MVENKLNLKFFSQFFNTDSIDNGRWYEFKIPHTVQLKDIVLHFDYVDLTSTIKALESMKNILNTYNPPKDFNELIDKLEKYKFDFEYHPHIDSLRMFDRIEVKSGNLNCSIYYPQFTEFRQKYLSLDKILSLPPETITCNTEIKIVRNSKYYKPNELYITVDKEHSSLDPQGDKIYYDLDEKLRLLPENEIHEIFPTGNVCMNNKNFKKYKTNDVLTLLSRNTYLNTELSKDIKEIYLIHKEHSSLEPKGCKNEIMLDGCLDLGFRTGCFKVYIDYKLTDITKFSELFNYLKQHKTVCVNIVFDDKLTSDEFEDYYIYYKSIAL